ncbi:MAG: hypothetical protein E7663_02500 [Ruminococcaceae bacterium]|nr:hypothetical protein [Oscillospiraceae bacterium]
MQLDRAALQKMLMLNDRQLEIIIRKLAQEYGLDLSAFQIKPGDMVGLRLALQNASDEDLVKLGEQLKRGKP